jgi:uncharacterized protein (TIGR02145 family)
MLLEVTAIIALAGSAPAPPGPAARSAPRGLATMQLRDPRDGRVYQVVGIGNLRWFAENLRYFTSDSRCYSNDEERCAADGRLYRFEDASAACPPGWRTPTDEDWFDLERAVGVQDKDLLERTARGDGPARRLKPGGATGFNAQFAGWISPLPEAVSTENGASGAYWTSSAEAAGRAWHRDISTDTDIIIRTPVSGGYWLAVRCVQDNQATLHSRTEPRPSEDPPPNPSLQRTLPDRLSMIASAPSPISCTRRPHTTPDHCCYAHWLKVVDDLGEGWEGNEGYANEESICLASRRRSLRGPTMAYTGKPPSPPHPSAVSRESPRAYAKAASIPITMDTSEGDVSTLAPAKAQSPNR